MLLERRQHGGGDHATHSAALDRQPDPGIVSEISISRGAAGRPTISQDLQHRMLAVPRILISLRGVRWHTRAPREDELAVVFACDSADANRHHDAIDHHADKYRDHPARVVNRTVAPAGRRARSAAYGTADGRKVFETLDRQRVQAGTCLLT
jgi:hypothetical protein